MIHAINKVPGTSRQAYVRPAVITQSNDNELAVRLELNLDFNNKASFNIKAQNALVNSYIPQMGDHVLVSGDNLNSCYITGILNQASSVRRPLMDSGSQTELLSSTGAKVKLTTKDESDILSLEDKHGHVIFEHDIETGKSKIFSPSGDLSLNAPHGNIEINSGKEIKCQSLGSITIDSATSTQLRVSAKENIQSSISVTQNGLLLSSHRVGLNAKKGEFNIGETSYKGIKFNGVLKQSKLLIGKIETIASRVIERFKNVYTQVEELQQTKAKRVRTLVDDTYQVNAKNCDINAKKTVKIDGEKIHLG